MTTENGNYPNGGSPTKRRRRRRLFSVIVTFVVLVVVIVALGLSWLFVNYQPPKPKSTTPVSVIVAKGESVSDIANELVREGVIRNAFVFRLYVRVKHSGQQFQAGTYEVAPGASISEITLQMTSGNVMEESIRVTIPEGYTVVEIADRLAASGVCSKQAFLQEEQKGAFTEPFLSQVSKNKSIKYRLEGYLFPDTYDFRKAEPAHEVIDVMLQDFQSHMNSAGITKALQSSGTTLPSLITEASMVEREAKVEHDRPLIASVIENRLKKGMKLQIDATIQYILGHRDIVTDQDLKVQDPYNTYLHYGLPPGPIGSPGMASIEAALHPAKTDYLYYVAKYDGSGESYFSATEADHLANITKSQQNLHAHGGK